jgi:uncharacterized membrane protein YeiH
MVNKLALVFAFLTTSIDIIFLFSMVNETIKQIGLVFLAIGITLFILLGMSKGYIWLKQRRRKNEG